MYKRTRRSKHELKSSPGSSAWHWRLPSDWNTGRMCDHTCVTTTTITTTSIGNTNMPACAKNLLIRLLIERGTTPRGSVARISKGCMSGCGLVQSSCTFKALNPGIRRDDKHHRQEEIDKYHKHSNIITSTKLSFHLSTYRSYSIDSSVQIFALLPLKTKRKVVLLTLLYVVYILYCINMSRICNTFSNIKSWFDLT